MTQSKHTNLPSIVNIIGKTPHGDLMLQSAPNKVMLETQLRKYFQRTMAVDDTLMDTKKLQRALNSKADSIPELNNYSFEANQRVYEIALTLLIAGAFNVTRKRAFIPAWQKGGQDAAMKNFTSKESWDGFIYENPTDGTTNASPVPIEVKSLMVDPSNDTVISPNQLLTARLPGLQKYFQSDGSICTVFVMPYTASGKGLSVNLKDASVELNNVLSSGALGCLCFFSLPSDGNGKTIIRFQCLIVDKSLNIADNGKIEHVDIAELDLGKV